MNTNEKIPLFRIYTGRDFQKIIQKVYLLERVTICDRDGRDTGVPFYRSVLPFKKTYVFNIPFQFSASPVFSSVDEEENFFEAIHRYSELNRVKVSFTSLFKYKHHQGILSAYNPVLYLDSDKKNLEARFSKNLRANIKRNENKARRFGITFSFSRELETLREFYNGVFSEQYIMRHKMVFQPLSLFEQMLIKKMCFLAIARRENQLIGGLIIVNDSEGLHYAWGASYSPENIATGTLLLSKCIDLALERGYKYFDFGSTPLSDNNLLDFKKRWGCHIHEVYRYSTYKHAPDTDLNRDYMFLRNIYSKLPHGFIRFIMPYIIPLLVR